ncbi:FUSC family protein [Alsobacter sp. KACC 23698]|uniref:FUSC family protein n=1 Tax=Alsobacter sp. KACC 23698 TaxID=3149229 RepID=A0AAU7JEX6_9HYPH
MKTFSAAMLALWVAFAADLPQPSWAMLTVLVVSQPIAGMVAAKALYRVVGTLVGAVMAVLMVAALADAPPFFLVALAVWVGLCTGVSVLLRDAPSSYGAMLSGYTAAIIGVPAAMAPLTVFDTATARCLEITLGILCGTVVSQVILPRTAGDQLRAAADRTIEAVRRFAADTLRADEDSAQGLADRRAMVADAVSLDNLRVFARFDTPAMRAASHGASALQRRILTLMSMLISLHDRIALMRTIDLPGAPALRALLEKAAGLLDPRTGPPPGAERRQLVAELRDAIARATPDLPAMQRDPRLILSRNMLARLDDVLTLQGRIGRLRDAVFAGRRVGAGPGVGSVRYREPILALVGGAISTTSVLAASALWIGTGWPSGGSAVVFAAVICSIMAPLDDPAAAAGAFLRSTVASAVLAGVALFGVLPLVDDFAGLAAVLAIFFVPFGMLLGLPRIGASATPLGLNFTALLGLANSTPLADFAAFANSALGLLAGIGVGILTFRLLRPLGVAWTVERIHAATLRDLARLAKVGTPAHRDRFEGVMFDRINALFSRLDPAAPVQRAVVQGVLAALRIGLNIVALRQAASALPEPQRRLIDAALTALARHFRRLAGGAQDELPSAPATAAMAALLQDGEGGAAEAALVTISAIRATLDRHSDFFRAQQPLVAQIPVEAPA